MKKKEDILDIAMNLNRVGNWAADDYKGKKSRIETFIGNTTTYIENLDNTYKSPFKKTLDLFLKDYPSLENEDLNRAKKSGNISPELSGIRKMLSVKATY